MLCLGTNQIVSANLVLNGGFESGTPDPSRTRYGQVAIVPVGATDIDEWEVYFGEVDYFFEDFYGLGSSRYIDLHSVDGGLGGIRQYVPTVVGQSYFLTFEISSVDLVDNPYDGGPITDMFIEAGDYEDYITYTAQEFQYWSGWETRQIVFEATDILTPISFYASADTPYQGNAGMWLDNISVTPVPEPTTLLLLGLGALMLRRKRQPCP